MEVKIPKEVRSHRETIFFGLSARQFFCSALAVGTAAGVYLGLSPILGKEPASWLCMALAAPLAVAGFFSYNGLKLEQFAWAVVKSQVAESRCPGVCGGEFPLSGFEPKGGERP